MATWKHKPQECPGDYWFDGKAVMTRGVADALTPDEILAITTKLKAFIQEENGADYLQVFEADDGRCVWCIDQLRRAVKESGEFTPQQLEEYDVWTMLLPEEY